MSVLTISHKQWVYTASVNWCLKCGRITDMEPIKTGLPGIGSKRCRICNTGIQINYLEDDDVTIEGDNIIPMPDNFCPGCEDVSTFESVKVVTAYDPDNKIPALKCKKCSCYIVDFGNELVKFFGKNLGRIYEVG